MSFLMAIVMISILIFAHELGHFLAAKANGILVHEFAVGMGPALYKRRFGETTYSLRLFPIGGFARMAGENFDEGEAWVPPERRFDKKSVSARAFVSVAGPLTNFLVAILIFTIVFMFVGAPSEEAFVGVVAPDWPAAEAGILVGDRIVEIGGVSIDDWSDVQTEIARHSTEPLNLVVERSQVELQVTLIPQIDEDSGKAQIGIGPKTKYFGLIGSLRLGWQETVWFTKQIIGLLLSIVTGKIPAEGAGPIGMIVMVGQVAQTGLANLLVFAAIISIQLGIFNLLPIPALDGSRLVFLAIEAVRGKPIDPEKESMVHFFGFILLLAFMVLVTFKDLQRLNIF